MGAKELRCAEQDSNLHQAEFESAASAGWAISACPPRESNPQFVSGMVTLRLHLMVASVWRALTRHIPWSRSIEVCACCALSVFRSEATPAQQGQAAD